MTPDEIIEELKELGFKVNAKRQRSNSMWMVTAVRQYKLGPRRGAIRFLIQITAASKVDTLRAVHKSALALLRIPG